FNSKCLTIGRPQKYPVGVFFQYQMPNGVICFPRRGYLSIANGKKTTIHPARAAVCESFFSFVVSISEILCIFAASFRHQGGGRQTYKKDVVTAFICGLSNFATSNDYRNDAMFIVHGLVYEQYINMRGLRHCLFCSQRQCEGQISGISKST
ncbi:MAG: hypothetical protein IJQ14_01990, partial [Bacteroidales bacterium]|nr:hypothetical protein [Bacteroidales bacterium]